jgi:hypothetical protein
MTCNMGDDVPFHNNKISVALAALGLDSKPVKDGGKNMCWSVEDTGETKEDEHAKVPPAEQDYWVDGKESTVSIMMRSSFNGLLT